MFPETNNRENKTDFKIKCFEHYHNYILYRNYFFHFHQNAGKNKTTDN